MKRSLIDDLSKRLLELEFKSNHSIKSKCFKWIVKNILLKKLEKDVEQRIVLGVKTLHIISGHKK